MNKRKLIAWIALVAFAAITWVAYAATPSTEAVQSRSDGLHIGNKASDRLGFYNGSPTPKPIIVGTVTAANLESALAATGLVATATPTATSTPTATATATATSP